MSELGDMSVIVLAGTIGAGKSGLTALLADHLGSKAFYESIDDNEVLPELFYADQINMLLLQIYFLNKRFDSIKKHWMINNVLDRSIYEDSLLFHLNADLGRATDTEVRVYDDLLANMLEELLVQLAKKHPDLLVHLSGFFCNYVRRDPINGTGIWTVILWSYLGLLSRIESAVWSMVRKNTKKVQKSKSTAINSTLLKIQN